VSVAFCGHVGVCPLALLLDLAALQSDGTTVLPLAGAAAARAEVYQAFAHDVLYASSSLDQQGVQQMQ
jgi:hypothetical protein